MSWTSGVFTRVLPNGLTLLLQREASAGVVAVVTHVRAGYFDEPDEWAGIAHVLEHMFFKGTTRRGRGAIAEETQQLGGYLNAHTVYDRTVYHTVLPAAGGGLERAMDIQADALMHSALDPGELAREIEVIIQEVKRKLDNPPALATESLYAELFRVHRMRRWRIGTEAGLRALSAQDLRRYYETRYTPDRAIVGIVGALDPDAALALAERVYGSWRRPAAIIEPGPTEPPERRASFRVLRGDIERPLAVMGWRTVGALHADTPALDLLAAVLGAGRGSWLWREVRQPGLASSVSADHYTPTEVGVFDVSLESEAGRLDDAAMRSTEIALTGAARCDEEDLARVRALVATSWSGRFETTDGRAGALCEFTALGDVNLADTYYDRLMTTPVSDVRRVAEEYLTPDAACAVVYLSNSGETRLAEAWPVRAGARSMAPGGGRRAPSAPTPHAPLPILPAGTRYPGDVTHVALPGADLLVHPKRGSGLVSLGLYVAGLRDAETPATAGLSALLVRTALRGAGGLSADELARAAERLGGSVAASAGVEAAGWGITVTAESLPRAAELLVTIAREPQLADDEVRLECSLQADDAARVRDDMLRYPLQRTLAAAFLGDPYGLPVLGEPESVRELSAEAVRGRASVLASSRAVVVAAGDLETGELVRGLSAFAEWPGAEPHGPPSRAPGWTAGRGGESRDKAQTALAMAFPAPAYASPDRLVLDVTAGLLSGLAGRLFRALREERSLAYTVTVMPWLRRRAGAVAAYIATAPSREEEARDAMLEELRRLAGDLPLPAEVERARNYAAGLVEIGRQRAAAVASEILEAWLNGVLGTWAATPVTLRAVTGEAIADVARRVFRPELRAEYVVRGR